MLGEASLHCLQSVPSTRSPHCRPTPKLWTTTFWYSLFLDSTTRHSRKGISSKGRKARQDPEERPSSLIAYTLQAILIVRFEAANSLCNIVLVDLDRAGS